MNFLTNFLWTCFVILFSIHLWSSEGDQTQHPHHAQVVFKSVPDFEIDLSNLVLKDKFLGGARGVYLLEDKTCQKTYTLKFSKGDSKSDRYFQEEVLADGLYDVLGVPVPKFVLVRNFTLRSRDTQDVPTNFNLARIAEFIEGKMLSRDLQKHHKEILEGFFMADVFLANSDVLESGNMIIKSGKFYHVDNKGALRNRSLGGMKGEESKDPWDANLLPELVTLPKHQQAVYGNISDEIKVTQAQAIVSKVKAIFQRFEELSTAVSMGSQDKRSLLKMLISRLQILEMMSNPGISYPADPLRSVSVFSATGAFIIAQKDKHPHILLGQRKSRRPHVDRTWVTLGGAADFGIDPDFETAASREIFEESTGTIHIPKSILRQMPFHDLVRPDHIFRQYFVYIDFIDECKLKTTEKPASLAQSHSTGIEEYHDFKWVLVEDFLKVDPDGYLGDMKLFEPFHELLKIDTVQQLLKEIAQGKKPLKSSKTQSMSKFGRVIEMQKQFVF